MRLLTKRNLARAVALGAVAIGTGGLAGNIIISQISFSLGSLIAEGTASRYGTTDYSVTLQASGIPEVTCTNQGGTSAPGRNPSRWASTGNDLIHDDFTKNGRYTFSPEAPGPTPGPIGFPNNGCPSANWTGMTTGFVYWTSAILTFTPLDGSSQPIVKEYSCVTTHNPDSISCTQISG